MLSSVAERREKVGREEEGVRSVRCRSRRLEKQMPSSSRAMASFLLPFLVLDRRARRASDARASGSVSSVSLSRTKRKKERERGKRLQKKRGEKESKSEGRSGVGWPEPERPFFRSQNSIPLLSLASGWSASAALFSFTASSRGTHTHRESTVLLSREAAAAHTRGRQTERRRRLGSIAADSFFLPSTIFPSASFFSSLARLSSPSTRGPVLVAIRPSPL